MDLITWIFVGVVVTVNVVAMLVLVHVSRKPGADPAFKRSLPMMLVSNVVFGAVIIAMGIYGLSA